MMAKEIVDELTRITKELWELNDKAAAARQKQLDSASSKMGVKQAIDSQPRSKQSLWTPRRLLPSKVHGS